MKGHEAFSSREEMLSTYKNYYGERVTFDTPVKIVFFKFNPSVGEEPTGAMLLDEAKVYTDGGSRGNPGDSACAFVICKMDDTVVEKSGVYLGVATNNQAEYLGFKHGLERARDLGIDKINLFSDSQLVVNQMKGLYKVKNQELAPLHQDVKEIASSFEKVTFTYVPRELNKKADGEVNRILDEQAKHRR
jgi:ribonuclease HI